MITYIHGLEMSTSVLLSSSFKRMLPNDDLISEMQVFNFASGSALLVSFLISIVA